MTFPGKFGRVDDAGDIVPAKYGHIWARQGTVGAGRLVIAPRDGQIHMCQRLAELFPEPYWVLYALVVPRGGSHAGRYQSMLPRSRVELADFLGRWGEFLEQDGRHHLWIAATDGSGQVVYDRHNLIYGYGPLAEMEAVLEETGLLRVSEVAYPSPHVHQYHECFDEQERALLDGGGWIRSELREEDEE